jgi:hydroxymethylglutaryl-CoA lyase
MTMNQTKNDWSLTDCPRDAMQGLSGWVSTERKVAYLSALLKVGFDVLDAGSFVSPKAMPQMADTAEVLSLIPESATRILTIVANLRGATEAIDHGRPDILGFPFSISETFQQRNTGGGIDEAWKRLEAIQNAAKRSGREVVVYLSMGFGNPYGDAWSAELVGKWSRRLHEDLGVKTLALSDTVGRATPDLVQKVFQAVCSELPDLNVGAHLHGRMDHAKPLMKAAWLGGCRSFDGALGGHGGCPMAEDELVGNLPTEILMVAPVLWGGNRRDWNESALEKAQSIRASIFDQVK